MRFFLNAAIAVFVLVSGVTVLAAPPRADRGDERAIRAAGASLVAATNRKDAKAAADHFTEDGDWINASGQLVKGREAIRQELAQFFAEPGSPKIVTKMLQIRFLTPTVAMIDGTSEHSPAPAGPPADHRHTVVYVKQDGKWLIAGIRAALSFPPSNYEHLKPLEWMIGTWKHVTDAVEPVTIRSTCRWIDNKNFIEHEVTSSLNNQVMRSVTERIGWDPREKKVKSWLFESDGGILQGIWTHDGKRWVVSLSGTLGDGTEVSALDFLTATDDNTFRFESTKRMRGGQPQPDRPPIELKRQPAKR
jgi:uncharacterized protein (TIGR02246 family)